MTTLSLQVNADSSGLTAVRGILQELKTALRDSAGVRQEFAQLQASMASVRGDAGQLKERIGALRVEMRELSGANQRLLLEHRELSVRSQTLAAENRKLTSEVDRLTRAKAANSRAANTNADAFRNLHGAARGAAGALGGLWLTYGQILPMLLAFGQVSGLKKVLEFGSEFEYQLAFVQGVTNDTSSTIQQLKRSLLDLADTNIFRPTEMAKGVSILAQAGLTARESFESLTPVMNLATLGFMNLDEAATFVQTAMHAFNLEVEDSANIVDVIAKTAGISAVSVRELSSAITNAAQINELYNISFEETNAMLAVMAQRHLVGRAAGTMLTNMLRDMSPKTEKAAQYMEALGVEVYDAAGNMRSIIPLLAEMSRKLSAYTPEAQSGILRILQNRQGMKAIVPLLAEAQEQLPLFYMQILKASEGAGFAEQAVARLRESVKGDFKAIQAAIEGTFIEAFERARSSIQSVSFTLRDGFRSERFQQFVASFTSGTVELIRWTIDHREEILTLAKAYVTLRISMAAATAAGNLANFVLAGSSLGGSFGHLGKFVTLLGALPGHAKLAALAVGGLTAAVLAAGVSSDKTKGSLRFLRDELTGLVSPLKSITKSITEFFEGLPSPIDIAADMFVYLEERALRLGYALQKVALIPVITTDNKEQMEYARNLWAEIDAKDKALRDGTGGSRARLNAVRSGGEDSPGIRTEAQQRSINEYLKEQADFQEKLRFMKLDMEEKLTVIDETAKKAELQREREHQQTRRQLALETLRTEMEQAKARAKAVGKEFNQTAWNDYVETSLSLLENKELKSGYLSSVQLPETVKDIKDSFQLEDEARKSAYQRQQELLSAKNQAQLFSEESYYAQNATLRDAYYSEELSKLDAYLQDLKAKEDKYKDSITSDEGKEAAKLLKEGLQRKAELEAERDQAQQLDSVRQAGALLKSEELFSNQRYTQISKAFQREEKLRSDSYRRDQELLSASREALLLSEESYIQQSRRLEEEDFAGRELNLRRQLGNLREEEARIQGTMDPLRPDRGKQSRLTSIQEDIKGVKQALQSLNQETDTFFSKVGTEDQGKGIKRENYFSAFERQVTAVRDLSDLRLRDMSISSSDAQQEEAMFNMRRQHAEELIRLEQEGSPLLEGTRQKYLELEKAAEESYRAQKEAASDWLSGVRRGMADYRDSAQDTFSFAKDAASRAFQSMEDAVVNFVKTSKLSLRDMVDSMISDLIRLQYRQMMFGGWEGSFLQTAVSAVGGFFGSSTPGVSATPGGTGPVMVASRSGGIGSVTPVEPPKVYMTVVNNTNTPVQPRMTIQPSADPREMIVEVLLDAIDNNVGGVRDVVGGRSGSYG